MRQATAHSVERNGGSAVGRSDAGHPGTRRPMQRDNHNVIQRKAWEMTIYQLTDRLHGRTVRVQADHIATTVASWLAELDACSPLVELLSRAVRDRDWPAIHGIADYLSVELQVAA